MEIDLKKGHGYWDLSRYPWGGAFRRFTENVSLEIKKTVERYSNGRPQKIICDYNGKEIGIQL